MLVDEKPAESPADSPNGWKARYTLFVLSLLGLVNAFAMRVNLSVAIVAMVNQTALTHLEANSTDWETDTCPIEMADPSTNGTIAKDGAFLWDETQQGQLLAAFFYGYAAAHIPLGSLTDRHGGKLVLGVGIFVQALFTVLTPLSAQLGVEALFVARFFLGLAQGGLMPAYQTLVSEWAPPQERSRFSIVYLGSYVGIVVSMALTGIMCETTLGWPLAFYFFGALGLLWCVPWFLLVFDSPAKHPRINPQERAFIETSLGSAAVKKRFPMPWVRAMCSPGVWACTILQAGIGFSYNLLLTGLPLYLANIMHFELKSNGLLSAVPYICGGFGSLLFGGSLDLLVTRGIVSRINGFRIFNVIALLIPALLLAACALLGCNAVAVVVLMAVNCFCMAAHFTSNFGNILVLAPNFSGVVFGIANTFSNTAAAIVPYVVAAFTKGNQTLTAWNSVFYLSAGVGILSTGINLLLLTDKEQPWNNPSKELAKKGAAEDIALNSR